MLSVKLLRKHIKLILWILLFTFIAWQVAVFFATKAAGPTYAGKVFGKKVSLDTFNRCKDQLRREMFMTYGKQANKVYKDVDLDKQTWMRIALIKEAKRRKLKISNKELFEYIAQIPNFQRDGKFDPDTYKFVVERVLNTPVSGFEKGIKNSLLIDKIRAQILSTLTITKDDIKNSYIKNNERAEASYVLFRATNYSDKVEVSPDKVKTFFKKNWKRFPVRGKVSFEYIKIDLDPDFLGVDKTFTEDELVECYGRNKYLFKDYKTSTQLPFDKVKDKVKQVLLIEKSQESAKEKAENLLRVASKSKGAWSELKNKGVEIKLQKMASITDQDLAVHPKVLNTAMNTRIGALSGPILAADGVYLIRVLKKILPRFSKKLTPELSQEIKRYLVNKKMREFAKKDTATFIKKIEPQIKKGESFSDVSREFGRIVKHTGEFGIKSYIEGLGYSRPLSQAIFGPDHKRGLYSNPVEVEVGYIVLFVDKFILADLSKYEEKKKEYQESYIKMARIEHLMKCYDQILKKAKIQPKI